MNLPDHPVNQSEDSSCSQALPSSNDVSKSAQTDSISLLCSLVSNQMKQHQQMMQFLSSFATSRFQQDQSRVSFTPQESLRSNSDGSDLSASTKISVNTVNLLASQLPEFSDKEEDDVEIWIQKVERVGRIHGASQEMMLLAASGKLVKSARKWFELGTGTINDTWISFKNALLRQFKRRIPYQIIIKKVEARKWNFLQESFNDYALEKLSLIQSLKLTDDDSIHFLIDGINNSAIRSAAAVIRATSLDDFLEEMHKVTISFGNLFKKNFVSHSRSDKVHNLPGDFSPKGDKTDKDQKDQKENQKEDYCVYCRSRGHNRSNCFKLMKKEKLQQNYSSSSSPVASIDPVTSTSSDDDSNAEASSSVAVVSDLLTSR
ncbi:hypothetical protein RF55_13564, partial [Lasius niger]